MNYNSNQIACEKFVPGLDDFHPYLHGCIDFKDV